MSMEINNPGNWIKPDTLDCLNTTSKDSWWCQAGSNFQVGQLKFYFKKNMYYIYIALAYGIAIIIERVNWLKLSDCKKEKEKC